MDILKKINDNISKGIPFVLATVVETSGHTPRGAGAKMIVYEDGSLDGTIGGGNFEKIVIDDSISLLKNNQKHLLKFYNFEESGSGFTAMICGGNAQVFMERFEVPNRLLIFGGGHICRALSKIAADLNFKIVVIDNRQEILESYKIPIDTILSDEHYDSNFPEIDQNSYIVIVTHGHKHDKEILAKVITENFAYLGMIGSKKKISTTYSLLEKEGISKELFKKVHAPIGLNIAAEGPHEIAIAIAAELISVKRAVKSSSS